MGNWVAMIKNLERKKWTWKKSKSVKLGSCHEDWEKGRETGRRKGLWDGILPNPREMGRKKRNKRKISKEMEWM